MATTQRPFIIATIILACVAVALTVTSLVTSFWVVATLFDPDGAFESSDINYGLFAGHTSGWRPVELNMELTRKPRNSNDNGARESAAGSTPNGANDFY